MKKYLVIGSLFFIAIFCFYQPVSAESPAEVEPEFLEKVVVTNVPSDLPKGIRIIDPLGNERGFNYSRTWGYSVQIENNNDEFVYLIKKENFSFLERIVAFIVGRSHGLERKDNIAGIPGEYWVYGRVNVHGYEKYGSGEWYLSYLSGKPEYLGLLSFKKTKSSNNFVEGSIFYKGKMYVFQGEIQKILNPMYGKDAGVVF